MFLNNIIVNGVLKCRHNEMLNKIFPNANINDGVYFYFGNTNSTFVVNQNGESVPTSANNPITNTTSVLIIRSDKFAKM